MKVAIVHDYIKEYGGAERVLEVLHEMWPKAPIFTLIYSPGNLGPHRGRVEKWDVRPSWISSIPLSEKLISPLRLIAPFVLRTWDFSNYDVVIVSATGAYNPNMITKGSARHVCYCHTPPRYLYGYPTARKWSKYSFVRGMNHLANHFLRIVDHDSAQRVDDFVANSEEVKRRIWKFYRREATVVYPPVDIPKVGKVKKQDYYLAGGRLARAKRADLAIKAANKLGFNLKVFGKSFAGYGEELRQLAGENVEFLGEVTDKEKFKLMAGAKAFIFPAEHEDFGITPVEAMGVGTPVIALRSGGVVESVEDRKTGIFFNKPTLKSLVGAIEKFEKMDVKGVDCRRQARKFGKERFVGKMSELVRSR